MTYIVNSMACACTVVSVIDLSELSGSSSKHTVMVPSFCLFAAINIFQFVTNMGFTVVTNWMSLWNQHDVQYLRTLEVAYWVVQSSWVWLVAMDFLFLSAGMFALRVSIGASTLRDYACFNRTTLVVGALSVLHFVFLIDVKHWMTGSVLGAFTTGIIGLFLLPMWLVMLSNILASKVDGHAHIEMAE